MQEPSENPAEEPAQETPNPDPPELEESPTDEGDQPELEEEKKKRGPRITMLEIILILGITAVLAAVLVPNFMRARARGQLTACKSNLKNMGTAMEMYSTDWSGKYPTANVKELLAPKYLKTIPECPAAGTDSYVFSSGPGTRYNTRGYQDYYFIECKGDHHTTVSVPANYPQYNGIVGLIER